MVYLFANVQALLVFKLLAEVKNFECISGADRFEELVDGVHQAVDLHLVGKAAHVHGQLDVLELGLLAIQ